jgi:hypothetical protein
MTGPKQSKSSARPADSRGRALAKHNDALTDAALGAASGGAVFPSLPAIAKPGSTVKIEDPNLLPAVQRV